MKKKLFLIRLRGKEKTTLIQESWCITLLIIKQRYHKLLFQNHPWIIDLSIRLAVHPLNSYSCPYSNNSDQVETASLQTLLITTTKTILLVVLKFWTLSITVFWTISDSQRPLIKCWEIGFHSTRNYIRVIRTYNPPTQTSTKPTRPVRTIAFIRTTWAYNARQSAKLLHLIFQATPEASWTKSETKALILIQFRGMLTMLLISLRKWSAEKVQPSSSLNKPTKRGSRLLRLILVSTELIIISGRRIFMKGGSWGERKRKMKLSYNENIF